MTAVAQRPAPLRVRVKPTPAWWRDAVGVACWSSALVVIVLWLSGRGMQALAGSLPDVLTSLGRLVGLVAADLLLIQVLLMARVPVIERSYGQDELARRHRLVGFWSFNLLLAHVVLITLGYAGSGHTSFLSELWTLVATYGGMLLAAASVVALTVVVVTSVRRARRVLRYESWHLLHLYAYVGVALSVPHEIWTGADFQTSGLARAYWWGSYAVAAGAIGFYRLGLPLWRTLRHGITVTSVVRESPDVVTVHMRGRGLHRLPVQAGQFFIWRFLDGPGWSRGNPYSLSAAPRHDHVQITAKDLGDGSSRLASLRPGTRVLIEGPYGRLTGEQRECARVVMLASGIGVTPMKALLEDMDYLPGQATLIYRARSEPDLVFRRELDELALARGVEVHYLVGHRARSRASWLPESAAAESDETVLRRLVPDIARRDVFICGPSDWMQAAADAARNLGVPEEQVHEERFTW
jgi:predicted ferric reductase